MEVNINKLRQSVQQLLHLYNKSNERAENKAFLNNLQKFLKQQRYVGEDVDRLFKILSENLVIPAYTLPLARSFEEHLLLLLTTSLRCGDQWSSKYQLECIALAKLMAYSKEAQRFAKSYFHNKPPPFESEKSISHSITNGGPVKKSKQINSNSIQCTELQLLKCCYQLLQCDTVYFRELWDWSSFIANNVQLDSPLKQLYSNHIIAMLTNMSSTQLQEINSHISTSEQLLFQAEMEKERKTDLEKLPELNTVESESIKLKLASYGHVTNIEGVLLPVFNAKNEEFYAQSDGCYDRIVKVDSTMVNLRSIALGVSAAKPICLSGPVGCGKTTLIEYLARKTGRICPKPKEIENHQRAKQEDELLIPKKKIKSKAKLEGKKRKLIEDEEMPISLENLLDMGDSAEQQQRNGFLRIQLGDQTDSKMLLGQYRCTDVPGEFVWLPGVLTQAVMHGYWLLLEDLDAATQDTYTILSSLLERNCLSVPGFRDSVKIEPGFQLFVTVRTNKSASNASGKSLYSLLDKYLYTINILPLSRNELCKVVSTNYPKLATVANRIVDVFLTFSSGNHMAADNLRQQETNDRADTTEQYVALPFEQVALSTTTSANSGRLVSTRDLVKLCQRSNAQFSVTSSECAYFVFQNAVDVFCSYLPQSKEKVMLITSIGAKLGIIRSRCEHFANEYKPEIEFGKEHIKIGRAALLQVKTQEEQNEDRLRDGGADVKRQKLGQQAKKALAKPTGSKKVTFSFTRLASCILERIAVCVSHSEPVLLVGETGVGKTSSVQYLAERTEHKLIVINMNNQSDVSDLVGGFKPVELNYVLAPLRYEFEHLVCETFNAEKNAHFLQIFATHFNNGRHNVIIRSMLNICKNIFKEQKVQKNLLPRWETLRDKVQKLYTQIEKKINISFAFIPGSLVNCISNGDWVLLDEINLASAETLECLSTILEPEGSVVLLERGDFTPVKRHPDFRIFACMNPNTDIGKKDLPVGIRNRFTEFFVDELTTDADLSLLVGDYLANTGIQRKSVHSIVQLYKNLRRLSALQLNDGLGNRPVYSLRTLCRSLSICARNLCGSIERNLYESFCLSFLTQLDPESHQLVVLLIRDALLSNAKTVLSRDLPCLGNNYLQFEGYWIQRGNLDMQSCDHYILTESVSKNLKDLARIISIGKLPILLQGPTSAGKTSLIDYVARRSGNRCLRINNHEHTDLQEYIGTYAADLNGKLTFKEGVLVQAMRHGFWIILDELNLASTDILEALNRVLDDNRELYIAETQTLVKAHPNFMLFATQNPPGLYGGRKTLSRAFKNRFIELHFADIPRNELEIILEKRCLIPMSYAKKMVQSMSQLQKHRKTTSKQVFTLRDLFRWGNRYTHADKSLLDDAKYDWNQHLVEEGYLVLSAKVRTTDELRLIEETLYNNFRKRLDLELLFDIQTNRESSQVSRRILDAIRSFKLRSDIVWTRNMTRMAVLTAKALEFDEPVLLVGPTGCGKTTVCQLLASIANTQLRILNCHMHTEGADFLGGLRPCRGQSTNSSQLFEWADGPLIFAMQEGSYFMADEISLAEDSVLERLNCILEPERSVLLAEKGGVSELDLNPDFLVKANSGFQFLATMNPGGDFGKKELSPALRNRFTEIWCLPSDNKEDLVEIAYNCMQRQERKSNNGKDIHKVAKFLVEIVLYIRQCNEKFRFSVRDILAWANYMVINGNLSFGEQAIFGLETIFLDALEMMPHESQTMIEQLKAKIIGEAIRQSSIILGEQFTLDDVALKRGKEIKLDYANFGLSPFFIPVNQDRALPAKKDFFFDAPTTKQNLFRLLSALSLHKPVLLEGPPGVGKTSIVESMAAAIGYQIVRINLCEHTDLADLFGTDLPAEDNLLEETKSSHHIGSFIWRDGPLLAALKTQNTWILLDELNLAPQSVLEGLNAVLDHRGEVYIPELNKSFHLDGSTRIFACQNPLKQGGGRKGLPQSFLNRFNKVYLRKLTTEDLLHVVNVKYGAYFDELSHHFQKLLPRHGEKEISYCNPFDIYTGNESDSTSTNFDLAKRLVDFSELLDRGVATMEFGYRGGPFEFNLRDILRWCDLLHNSETGYIQSTSLTFHKAFHTFLLTLYERMQLVYYQRMRCDQDKIFIRNAFANVFQCNSEQLNDLSEDVALYWTTDKIYFNDVVLERCHISQEEHTQDKQGQAPLLLDTQRQLLKQCVETVHMEKPLLLCGGGDSGKTKLIDALCSLSNRECQTDTIDDSVTGSFQQIDLNRHLEVIYRQVELLVFSTVQKAFLQKTASEFVGQLWSKWSIYKQVSRSTTESQQHSVAEELVLFSRRLNTLSHIIDKLKETPDSCRKKNFPHWLSQQAYQLKLLQTYVKSADSLNTGGSFEWVDSRIVTALKCGQYILLEHVNLCSSAVLDRLNPVFEPNGSLLIAEKGISAQDSAEVVYKSTNFRAFLTIDPKNGELSRAMRNRCVELSINRESYSVDDMRAFVYGQGVLNPEAIDCILQIHGNICGLTEGFNGYSISHLIQCAFLSAAYKSIGYDLKRAIYVAAMEVYVYAASTDLMGYGLPYYQNKLREIVLAETEQYDGKQDANVENHLDDVILTTDNLTSLAMVKLQSSALRILLENESDCQYQLGQIFNQMKELNLKDIDIPKLCKYFLLLLYDASSVNDLEMRYLYLKPWLNSEQQNFSKSLYDYLQQQKSRVSLKNLPWNRKLFPRLRDYALNRKLDNFNELSISLALLARLLIQDIPMRPLAKLQNLDALQYSQALRNKNITEKYSNDFLANLANFLDHLNKSLLDQLEFVEPLNLPLYAEFVTKYLWFNRLVVISQEKLLQQNNELYVPLMHKLVLHFQWLNKHLLSKINVKPKIQYLIERMQQYVVETRRPLNVTSKIYAKQFTQFQPYYCFEQIEIHNQLEQLQQLLGVVPKYGSMELLLWSRKWLAIQSDEARKWRAFLRVNTDKFHLKSFDLNLNTMPFEETLQKSLQNLQILLTEESNQEKNSANIDLDLGKLKNLITNEENSEDYVHLEANKIKSHHLLLAALREYFMERVLGDSSNVNFSQQVNPLYAEQLITANGPLWQCLNSLESSSHVTIIRLWQELANLDELPLQLGNLYKAIRTYQRQYRNALQCYQMENLATRLDCVHGNGEEDLDSRYKYQGPGLVNILLTLICHPNGQLLSVPLNELRDWRTSLQETRQLIWQNSHLTNSQHSKDSSLNQIAKENARQLIKELEFVAQQQTQKETSLVGYQSCLSELKDLLEKLTTQENDSLFASFDSALINTLVGVLELSVLSHAPLIDPVEKNRLKNQYVAENIDCLTHLSTVYDFMKIIMKYKHFGHEIYDELQLKLQAARQHQQQLSQKVALRPEQCLYANLVQDLTHFLHSNGDCTMIHKLIKTLRLEWQAFLGPQVATKTQLKTSLETMNKIELWLANAQRFVHHTLSRYDAYYQDFVLPLKCAVNQMRYGLEQVKVLITRIHQAGGSLNESEKLHQTLTEIVQYPTSPLTIRSPHLYGLLAQLPHSEHEYFRLLKAKLSELNNSITIATSIDESSFVTYDDTLTICNQIWEKEEERRCKERAEAESLYVTKTKGGIEDEELVELREIEQNFPTNLEEDFAEFAAAAQPSLEQVLKLDKKNAKANQNQIVTEQDYAFLAQNFIELMTKYTSVYYKEQLKTKSVGDLQLLEPYQSRLKVFTQLHDHFKAALGSQLDGASVNGLAFGLALQQRQLDDLDLEVNPQGKTKTYDYYKDSNINELQDCLSVLDRIEKRVLEQLELYPEHAGLADIKLVIFRIRQLPAHASVVRFNTGFQLLRQKLALWNEVAHKNNNLVAEETEVAEFVQRWTKLELQHWRNSLNGQQEQVEQQAYRYWFFIYNLLQQFIQQKQLNQSYTDIKYAEQRFGQEQLLDAQDLGEERKVDLPQIISILRQFVESSSYGDFHIRLQLLYSFEMYLHNVDRAGKIQGLAPLIAALNNLQLYFSQFANDVNDTCKARRAPIEKKLREFVKIQSYNKDLSYFSMRNNVATVHRNLNKFLKEYRLVLQQKISAEVFQPKDATARDYSFGSDKGGKSLRHYNKMKYIQMDRQLFVASEKLILKYPPPNSLENGEENALLQRLGKHFKTARNIVKETLSNVPYGELINALDELLASQLERCEHLRNLNVDRSKERAQQKVEAKQILQQKRKALTDLFKTLNRLGVNYKTGLMELSLRPTELVNFQLSPFCIKAMLPRLHPNALQLNEHLDLYYMKSVFKLKLLQNIMLSPLSELGPPNIERIKGFAVDLFLLVQQQRQHLSQSTKHLYELRQSLSQVHQIADIVTPKEEESSEISNSLNFSAQTDLCCDLKENLCRIYYVFRQWQLLLTCAPPAVQQREREVNVALKETLPLPQTELLDISDQILKSSQLQLSELNRSRLEFPSSQQISHYQKDYQQILTGIEKAVSLLHVDSDEYLPLAQPLLKLLEQLKASKIALPTPHGDIDLANVDTDMANIAHAVLMALEKIYKQHSKSVEQKEGEQESELSEAVQDQHLKQHLNKELNSDWQLLNLPKILTKLTNVLLVLKHAHQTKQGEKLLCLHRLVALLPILEQYQLLADYLLLQQLSTHKVSAKMLSIILTVFVEIGSKGFCVPPDLMQDEDEGQSKQDSKNGEGFGLEDGTGENDASDKIESEDQLDDAKRPEDRKDDGDKQEPDCKEEKGIEMSDDFDAKMQDIEKPEKEEDDSGESEEEEELNKEMGDTEEGAEKLDDQIWGDDEEKPEEEEDQDMNEEDQGKGSKDEKDQHNDLDTKNEAAKEDGKDEHENDGLDATNEPNSEDKRKEQAKDIDDMKEPEMDEEQTNAMHNDLEEPPEPEEMDLGDMNDLDEGHEDEDQQATDDNPFDIDTMKENMQDPEEAQEEPKEQQTDQPQSDQSDSEEEGESGQDQEPTTSGQDDEVQDPTPDETQTEEPETQKRGEIEEDKEEDENQEGDQEKREEKPEQFAQSKDKSSKEENVQSVPETEKNSSVDQVQQQDEDIKQDQKLDEQDTGEEKDGVGQAENDDNEGGHQGVAETKETVSQEERKNEKQTQEKRKQGRTNEERSLGEAEKNKLKQLKTIDQMKADSKPDESDKQEPDDTDATEAEEYQHVKDPKNSDKTTLDNATEEQSKKIQHQEDEQNDEDSPETENADELMAEDEEVAANPEDEPQLEQLSSEKTEQKSDKPSKSEKSKEHVDTPDGMEIEGEIVPTMTVPRNAETTAHSNMELLLDKTTQAEDLSTAEQIELRQMYQQQLTTANSTLPQHEDYDSWQGISNRMTQNARELCEQLRLILEPTKCTRLKGDYRTGRRINMKKIIPYIASQFRKDKIWLRRTKPAQRDYKITIAIDDSKSMHHNNSKTLTLEAISLVSQALTLLESGRLSIVSFGESPNIILNHTEQFDGPRLVSAMNFAQDKTKIAGLLDFIRTVNMEESGLGGDNGLFENLLLILSDGRNIFSEGSQKVKNAIKLARLQRIFLVYIIIDNPDNKNSILDIQHVEVNADGSVNINSYLDSFPFPYYVIVRDLNQLPLVLSEAMRQWFELVNSE
ncbi:LOW QUALITY PROTEIN: midasin [Drosophila tropicalis]|uniref:LOW QUALITY PROTEIN: midasin n=1 Tax=Drosophila tropicalis TaxID=46794 RepID=UPI0035ABD934